MTPDVRQSRNTTHCVRAGRVALSAEPLGPSDLVRMARVEEAEEHIYCTLSDLPSLPDAFRLRLHDAEGRIHWEPDGEELRATGTLFAAVLRLLYDGSRARASLALNRGHLLSMPIAAAQRAGDEDTEQMTDELSAGMRRHGLAYAFSLSARSDVFPDETYITDYWWVWKRHLGTVLAEMWSPSATGVVAPRPDRGALTECFHETSPCRLLEGLLSACRLVFQGDGASEGEAMIVLSHHLSMAQVEDALDHTSVRSALRRLNKEARLVDWVSRQEEIGGHTYTVREKPRPGGADVRRVHAYDAQAEPSEGGSRGPGDSGRSNTM